MALKEAMNYLGSRKHKYNSLPVKPFLIQFTLLQVQSPEIHFNFASHSLVYQMATLYEVLHKNSAHISCFPL
jgi:hypothetical protein